jgi:hypothetical protein
MYMPPSSPCSLPTSTAHGCISRVKHCLTPLLLRGAVTQAEIEGLYKRFRALDRGRKVRRMAAAD